MYKLTTFKKTNYHPPKCDPNLGFITHSQKNPSDKSRGPPLVSSERNS
jgi:hypothetical protein